MTSRVGLRQAGAAAAVILALTIGVGLARAAGAERLAVVNRGWT